MYLEILLSFIVSLKFFSYKKYHSKLLSQNGQTGCMYVCTCVCAHLCVCSRYTALCVCRSIWKVSRLEERIRKRDTTKESLTLSKILVYVGIHNQWLFAQTLIFFFFELLFLPSLIHQSKMSRRSSENLVIS